MKKTAAETLGHFFVDLKVNQIPEHEISVAKTLIADYFGVAIGGSQTDSAKIAARFALETGGAEQASLIGMPGKVPAVHAAFANAIASHSIELDDVDVLALFHFSPPVVSAALAAAQWQKASGADFVAAVVAGCEMMARMSNAANFSLRDRGFHTTPTCGVFGATVAAGRLMGLTGEQMTSALGLAGAQASGLMEMYGPSMQKRFNPGPAARNGLTAAHMALLGYTGAATILDGERGFCRAFTDQHDIGALTDKLGEEYRIFVEYKPYSCARPIHNAIDCALDIADQLNGDIGRIAKMNMRRHPAWAHYHLNTRPETYHEAQVSLPYSVAIALLEGGALPPQYSNERLRDPNVLALIDMLTVEPDDGLPRGVSCLLEIETTDGQRLASQIDHPRGSIANPMSQAEMHNKIHMLADPVIGAAQVSKLIATVDTLDSAPDISSLSDIDWGAGDVR